MAEEPSATDREPLSRTQADEVLRYWLLSLRLEEALQNRPRARRAESVLSPPRVDLPSLGQDYFKMSLRSEVQALLSDRTAQRRPFDAELCAFFESWLYTQYRRSEDESELSHLLCFPVVHLPRGELAGLLRCGVRLSFANAGAPFKVPTRAERMRGTFPAPPTEVRVAIAPRAEGSWPFFIDTRLLSYPLGLSSEEIDALFDKLRAREVVSELDMLECVTEALETVEPTTKTRDVETLLSRLLAAMQKRLSAHHLRAEAYPVGIVVDGTQAKTTWHLQRELLSLLEASGDDAFKVQSCLGAYLTGRALVSAESPQRALFEGPALTQQQRRAAELFWGSPLSAVQGPPGTGKTTLILHLCAEWLVRKVEGLLDAQKMSPELLLVTSSNNRAVDNVLSPLAVHSALPLGLRVGSRQVCEQTLLPQLQRTAAWLRQAEAEPKATRQQHLQQQLDHFSALRAQMETLLIPRKAALAVARQREKLERELATVCVDQPTPQLPLAQETARTVLEALRKVQLRLTILSKLCEGKTGLLQLNAIRHHFQETERSALPALEAALTDTGLPLNVPLPPLATPVDVAEMIAEWEEGAEQFLTQLGSLRDGLESVLQAEEQKERVQRLRDNLSALEAEAKQPYAEPDDELARALFLAALQLREAWAKYNATLLREAVESALFAVQEERSLRPLFRDQPQHATLLCQLFGIFGSTLLSIGNCLPHEEGAISRVIIDEAGQCHPAHAVSALSRCRSALLIGDVHQLSPVVELTVDDDKRLLRSARLQAEEGWLRPYRVHAQSLTSAQALADRAVLTRHTLVDHFRCQPEIIAISDALCSYGLTVHTPRARETTSLLQQPVTMFDLRGEQERHGGSLMNQLELRETLRLLSSLLETGVSAADVAIITPYRGQLELLRREVMQLGIPVEASSELSELDGPGSGRNSGLALGTVHRFQGGERKIVLFSSVITRASSLPFLNARPNLLNVAVSRAQHHFVCLGHRQTLAQGALTRVLVNAATTVTTS